MGSCGEIVHEDEVESGFPGYVGAKGLHLQCGVQFFLVQEGFKTGLTSFWTDQRKMFFSLLRKCNFLCHYDAPAGDKDNIYHGYVLVR